MRCLGCLSLIFFYFIFVSSLLGILVSIASTNPLVVLYIFMDILDEFVLGFFYFL